MVSEAVSTGWFDTVERYDIDRLENVSPDWLHVHHDFIFSSQRGLGNWIWKPHIISLALEGIANGEVLCYLDAGCELNKFAETTFQSFIQLASSNNLLAFAIDERPINWTKSVLLDNLGLSQDYFFLNSNQIEAGVILMKSCPAVKAFISLWQYYCVRDNYKFVTDSTASERILENAEFREHRHDQAIFTCLLYALGLGITLQSIGSRHELRERGFYDVSAPFHIHRNASPISSLPNLRPIAVTGFQRLRDS